LGYTEIAHRFACFQLTSHSIDVRPKERLTGAIILVVLIVLVVPELLTGPRQADTQPGGAADEGPPLRSYTIELGERSGANPARPLANRAAEPDRQPDRQPEAPAASVTPKAEPPPARTAMPAKAAEDAVRESQRPSAKRSTEAVPESGWSVQVGSFESRANADRLTGELRRLGFRSFITEGTKAGHKLYRVRVGPEADRAATQALAERLRTAGHPGAIVPHP
jgi:DedD protein